MSQDAKKQAAARAALEEIPPGATIGVGTGSTVDQFIAVLAAVRERIARAVSSSEKTTARLRVVGIPVVDLNDVDRLPLYVDGADEATRERLLIKGGGGALTREKILAQASDRFVCIVDDSKLVERLGAFPLPVEVLQMAVGQVVAAIAGLGGRAERREGFTTDNGNAILDAHGLEIADPGALEERLNAIPGVVANGLFCGRPADLLLVGTDNGVERFD